MALAADLAEGPRIGAAVTSPEHGRKGSFRHRMMGYLPRGNLLEDAVWRKRHDILQWLLLLHLPALTAFGFYLQHPPMTVLTTVAPIALFRVLGGLPTGRRVASFFTTAGIVYCSAALVVLANGAIEAHFHFFVIVGFIALYQDWVPFGWNIAFTVLSHGLGSTFRPNLMFNHPSGMDHPWTWSVIHGLSVLATCIGVVLFWRTNEDEQRRALTLTQELGEVELNRRRFASELLVNLARRNQSLLYRQLDIINQLEHAEQDPDALAGLFRLDHLATRIRRNAENLLVLSGAEPPRVWGKPVPLTDVVRAAIAETEDLSRVNFVVDERLAVLGQAVIDLTHLLAELIENAVRSSPPDSQVTIRTTPDIRSPGTVMLTVEDWGVGMPDALLAEANEVLSAPRDVDALVSNRLGLHVVSRLANRYAIQVVLTATSGSGITAVVLLPPGLFTSSERPRPSSVSGPLPTSTAGTPHSGPLPQRPRINGATGPSGLPLALPSAATPTPPSGRELESRPPTRPTRPIGPTGRAAGTPPVTPPGVTAPQLSRATPPTGGPRARTGPDWEGWWDRDGPVTGPSRSAPIRLSRRVPQAHLAPELQRDRQAADRARAAADPLTPPPDAARAREALSRYQASRRAALAENAESAETGTTENPPQENNRPERTDP